MDISDLIDQGTGERRYPAKNNHKAALKAYEQALTLDPKYVHAWYNKGIVLDKLIVSKTGIVNQSFTLICLMSLVNL